MRLSDPERRGIAPLAIIKGHASHAQAPAWFTTAPIFAIGKLLDKVGWKNSDVDLFEINEAFALVVMAAMRANGLKRGVASLCIGGGEASALAVELL